MSGMKNGREKGILVQNAILSAENRVAKMLAAAPEWVPKAVASSNDDMLFEMKKCVLSLELNLGPAYYSVFPAQERLTLGALTAVMMATVDLVRRWKKPSVGWIKAPARKWHHRGSNTGPCARVRAEGERSRTYKFRAEGEGSGFLAGERAGGQDFDRQRAEGEGGQEFWRGGESEGDGGKDFGTRRVQTAVPSRSPSQRVPRIEPKATEGEILAGSASGRASVVEILTRDEDEPNSGVPDFGGGGRGPGERARFRRGPAESEGQVLKSSASRRRGYSRFRRNGRDIATAKSIDGAHHFSQVQFLKGMDEDLTGNVEVLKGMAPVLEGMGKYERGMDEDLEGVVEDFKGKDEDLNGKIEWRRRRFEGQDGKFDWRGQRFEGQDPRF
ncbi:hypothetical protein C8R47DRAFT_1067755 [Mycena vitilis]|nr:hypothetical protein C8R47DRAFT_1067755 [Mycena vitilis]